MSDRGTRFESHRRSGRAFFPSARARVGNAVYHTVGDRDDALKALDLGFTQAYAEIGHKIGVLPDAGSAERVKAHPAEYAWWTAAVVPLMHQWRDFHAERSGTGRTGPAPGYVAYGTQFETDWSVYEAWQDKLRGLRDGARAMGIKLETPTPAPLPTTVVKDVADAGSYLAHKAKDAVGDVWDLGKVAIYGGLALLGVVAVGSLVSNLKSGKDPAQNYLALASGLASRKYRR